MNDSAEGTCVRSVQIGMENWTLRNLDSDWKALRLNSNCLSVLREVDDAYC